MVPKGADLVTPKLPALREYQHSLAKPAPPAGSFDAAASARGRTLFAGSARCATCHSGAAFTDEKLHAPAETGMDPAYAARSATKKYRATPLRALWQHAPYFHDGKAQGPARGGGALRRHARAEAERGAEEGPGRVLEVDLRG